MQTHTENCALVAAALLGTVVLAGCERPPIDAEQVGFRGTAMVTVDNPRERIWPDYDVPDALPAAPAAGPKAGDIYQNVQVLGDLSVGQFTRVMQAMTAWVAPEQGCNYCHNAANLASDDIYTKVVSRRMIQMTQNINSQWSAHVQNVGVTCYTCHRGNNVPEYIWFENDVAANQQAYTGNRSGQNTVAEDYGYHSMLADPLSYYLVGDNLDKIAVNTDGWEPTYETGTIKDTENTYSLMFHMSESLNVNCTFCHNSRAFSRWEESTPQRATAWHGLRMVANMNNEYMLPLTSAFPDYRLGDNGDVPKVNCATCHQGQNKPLGGANMVDAYPSLQWQYP
ncbi:MAG: photosynthetic reaction center cytochrome PufC [Pseudomonadota bacterium]